MSILKAIEDLEIQVKVLKSKSNLIESILHGRIKVMNNYQLSVEYGCDNKLFTVLNPWHSKHCKIHTNQDITPEEYVKYIVNELTKSTRCDFNGTSNSVLINGLKSFSYEDKINGSHFVNSFIYHILVDGLRDYYVCGVTGELLPTMIEEEMLSKFEDDIAIINDFCNFIKTTDNRIEIAVPFMSLDEYNELYINVNHTVPMEVIYLEDWCDLIFNPKVQIDVDDSNIEIPYIQGTLISSHIESRLKDKVVVDVLEINRNNPDHVYATVLLLNGSTENIYKIPTTDYDERITKHLHNKIFKEDESN